jgi:predicted phosphoribosyltransferase
LNIRFRDREQAGQLLAGKLEHYAGQAGIVVLGLPRGGVPVASQVARRLGAPLDVFLVRKLGVPGHEELAMGAIASGDICILNEHVIAGANVSPEEIKDAILREERELKRRESAYRVDSPMELRDRIIILIDDGLATGASMRAAVAACRQRHPARVIVAVPVAAWETCEELRSQVDELVCLQTPANFEGVGQWYEDFSQTTDDEVRALLNEAKDLRREPVQPAPCCGGL